MAVLVLLEQVLRPIVFKFFAINFEVFTKYLYTVIGFKILRTGSLFKSEVCRHLMDNPDHKVDFAKPNILSNSGDSARLLILESLFIQKYEPLLNVDSKSAPLYLFNC